MRRAGILAFASCLFAALAQAGPEPAPLAPVSEHTGYWIRTLEEHPLSLVRKNAARVLGSLNDPHGLAPLIAALRDTDGGVRAEAARALGYLRNESAIPPLETAHQKDADPRVRRNAREAAERIRAYQEFLKRKTEKEEKKAAAQGSPKR